MLITPPWRARVPGAASGHPTTSSSAAAAALESTASAVVATGQRVATPPPSPRSLAAFAARRTNCFGCLYECGNQEAHYGGCLDDPYADDEDEVAKEVASFHLTFGNSGQPPLNVSQLADELQKLPSAFIDIPSVDFEHGFVDESLLPWAVPDDEVAGTPEW